MYTSEIRKKNSEKAVEQAVKFHQKEGEQRILNGGTIDSDQPKLLSGGVLRSYQMDGFCGSRRSTKRC